MPVLLLPHSELPEALIEKVITFFGPINTCLPWFMEHPGFINDKAIEFSYPPESLKPKEEFRTILKEYSHWVKQNSDRSYLQIIKSDQGSELTDNTTWEIRQMLGRTVQSASGKEETNILRWHLLLHLAREIEEQRMAADKILKSLKDKNSLLEGSIEKGDSVTSLLVDLPQFEKEPVLTDINLGQVLEAWFALFGGNLKKGELLITLSRHVMDYLGERWDGVCGGDGSTNISTLKFKLPDLSPHAPEEQNKIKREYGIDKRLKDIKDLIFILEKDPARNLAKLDNLSGEFNESFPWNLSGRTFKIILKHLYSASDKEALQREGILGKLSSKTIIFAEEGPVHS
ncbi:hypothetical protein ACFL0H_02350 [Thermodesulfobacteriota bacterium]